MRGGVGSSVCVLWCYPIGRFVLRLILTRCLSAAIAAIAATCAMAAHTTFYQTLSRRSFEMIQQRVPTCAGVPRFCGQVVEDRLHATSR